MGRVRAIAALVWALAPSVLCGQRAPTGTGPLAWPQATRESRPWTRWWWMGSAVDSATLTASLKELATAGFGGVEITAIYGAKGAEATYVPYLSDRWVHLLRHTVSEAQRLGMGVDMPPGSGWRTGGPFVPAADANTSLRISTDTVSNERSWTTDVTNRRIDAVLAVSDDGRMIEISQPLRWQAPPGRWTIYVAEERFSGDNVKRPAPGGEGFAIDVFSRAAVQNFLRAYADRLAILPRGALRSYFHDSFEYTGTGSAELFDTFRRRREYDLARYLPALLGRGDADTVARVRSDYRQTIDDMLLDHFVRPLADWSHARGSLSRNQAHGSPGNLLDLYAAADIPETEYFGAVDTTGAGLLINKLASSAAHVAGKPLASAESFTWLGEHFTSTLGDVKQAADELFLAGINHLIYHGTAYSPRGAAWPGWQFYASTEFNPRNAIWHDLPTVNQYVTRVQSLLQSGRPDNDVLLYWPVWDNWHDASGGERALRMDFRVHDDAFLSGKPVGQAAASLWKSGIGFDYLSDRLLDTHVAMRGGRLTSGAGDGGGQYATIVVPRTDHMPPETMRRLLSLAGDGATIIVVDRLPADVPGLTRLQARRDELAAATKSIAFGETDGQGVRRARVGRGQLLMGGNLATLLVAAGVHRENMVEVPGVRFLRRRTDDGHVYFITQSRGRAVDGWVPLATPATSVVLMDPLSGRMGLARSRKNAAGETEVYLQLELGSSILVRTLNRPAVGASWVYRQPSSAPVTLRGGWAVRFLDGGPAIPTGFRSDSAGAWTGRGDADADRFAGTARYTLRFDAPPLKTPTTNYLLDLGRVAASARVRLNGRELGALVMNPFRVETGALRSRNNVLEVEVTNLSANRVRDLDARGVEWKIFHDINYVGLDYKPFNASRWPIRSSGLLGPVTLQPLASVREMEGKGRP